MDMPMDVFLKIASSLEPLDLIYLSRMNKEFHAIFMSHSTRNSVHVDESSRECSWSSWMPTRYD
ncbi:hypothetical protein L208DRAFT_1504691 [Tricholoma matsutake]|nr:hypothetical protein L208DRAFT_1504691 [Tricholoma matsutake 945]